MYTWTVGLKRKKKKKNKTENDTRKSIHFSLPSKKYLRVFFHSIENSTGSETTKREIIRRLSNLSRNLRNRLPPSLVPLPFFHRRNFRTKPASKPGPRNRDGARSRRYDEGKVHRRCEAEAIHRASGREAWRIGGIGWVDGVEFCESGRWIPVNLLRDRCP